MILKGSSGVQSCHKCTQLLVYRGHAGLSRKATRKSLTICFLALRASFKRIPECSMQFSYLYTIICPTCNSIQISQFLPQLIGRFSICHAFQRSAFVFSLFYYVIDTTMTYPFAYRCLEGKFPDKISVFSFILLCRD